MGPTANRPGRTWRVPPALMQDVDGDVLEGAGVLRDLDGAPVAVLLWQAAREVVLWAQADERAGLFAPTAHWDRLNLLWNVHALGEVAPFLRALSEAVLMEPESTDPEYVALLCRQVSEWAMEVGAGETALWYAQAAAHSVPSDARAALSTGCIALRLGKLDRAESWLLRAVAVARRRDWETYALAYVALGGVSEQRGHRALARRRLMLALRTTRRAAIPEIREKVARCLMRLALDDGSLADAARYARRVRRIAPGPGRVLLIAELRARSGETRAALGLLRKLLPSVADPERRMYIHALLALAHALDGNRSGGLAHAWTVAWGLAGASEGADLAVRCFLALAAAARQAGNPWNAERAEEAARAAIRTGLDRWLVERYAAGPAGVVGT